MREWSRLCQEQCFYWGEATGSRPQSGWRRVPAVPSLAVTPAPGLDRAGRQPNHTSSDDGARVTARNSNSQWRGGRNQEASDINRTTCHFYCQSVGSECGVCQGLVRRPPARLPRYWPEAGIRKCPTTGVLPQESRPNPFHSYALKREWAGSGLLLRDSA